MLRMIKVGRERVQDIYGSIRQDRKKERMGRGQAVIKRETNKIKWERRVKERPKELKMHSMLTETAPHVAHW